MDKIIFWAILIIFPLGQLTKIDFVNLIDVLVVILAVITILKKPKYPSWFKYFIYFILSCIFSILINHKLFEIKNTLYLLRLFSYSFIAVYISNFYGNSKDITRKLVIVAVLTAVIGWFQYLFLPDTRFLYNYGWDDHLNRMIGSFHDPTYLGLILVLGSIVAIKLNYNFIFYFLLLSLSFTYSRSSYLIASLILLIKQKYLALFIFVIVILFLPKMTSEGTNLVRTASINNKFTNYSETLSIIKRYPLWGVGFNNICSVKIKDKNNLHSCSGADSSILFLLAITGVIGVILFINFLIHVPKSNILTLSFIAVFIHSFFSNSLFYPHIMFWMFVLLGLGVKSNSKAVG